MARNGVPEQEFYPYHVTGRCHNKEQFHLPLHEVWQILSEQLFFVSHSFNFEIHSFVLMKNHFHMILSTPESNLGEGMSWFMREAAREANRVSGRINQLWGGRYFRSMMQSPLYYLHAYKYVYLNPVKAGASSCVTDYKFSSIRSLIGLDSPTFPITDSTLFDMTPVDCIDWLNTIPNDENWSFVKKALKKKVFTLPDPLCPKTKHELNTELL